MAYYLELRELTASVINPEHDKRKKYGPEGIASLPKGYRFFVQETRGAMIALVSVDDRRLGYVHAADSFGRRLMDNSTVEMPRSAREVIAFQVGRNNDHATAEVLERLCARGFVSLRTVADIAIAIDAEGDEPS